MSFEYETVSSKKRGYVHAVGRVLHDAEEQELLIKGIAFGNEVWGNPSIPSNTHHTEDSYRELSEAGFNSIRFYLNYGIFEDDETPYEYKQSGWDWLDRNLRWAEKYNMYLILNMHYPQGGFQSNGNGMELWMESENQLRLAALWREIARRYVNEPIIAAYDLLNEPVVPEQSNEEDTFNQWRNLAQKIVSSIREVDQNHLILVERLNASKNIETGVQNWTQDRNGRMNLFLIEDMNIAYEFHMYDPMEVTHQNARWIESLVGKFTRYPDDMKNKEFLRKKLARYLEVSKEFDIPLYLGEFGCIVDSFKDDRGGARWSEDMLELCIENRINFNYHTYHEPAFGLYLNPASQPPANLNNELMEVFKSKLNGK